MIKKFGQATWKGGIKDGKGSLTTESRALVEQPYGFNTRFEDKPGTNPEELIGVAHAGCFSMALSKIIEDADFKAELIDTKATVSLDKKGDGFEIPAIALAVKLKVPGAKEDQLNELANKAKDGCPVSKLLNAEITMTVEVLNS